MMQEGLDFRLFSFAKYYVLHDVDIQSQAQRTMLSFISHLAFGR